MVITPFRHADEPYFRTPEPQTYEFYPEEGLLKLHDDKTGRFLGVTIVVHYPFQFTKSDCIRISEQSWQKIRSWEQDQDSKPF